MTSRSRTTSPRMGRPSRSELADAPRPMNRREILEDALRVLAPRVPAHEFEAIVDHALMSGGLRHATPEAAAWLSMVAYTRHRLTEYDQLLDEGYDQDSARFFVLDEINGVLEGWESPRR